MAPSRKKQVQFAPSPMDKYEAHAILYRSCKSGLKTPAPLGTKQQLRARGPPEWSGPSPTRGTDALLKARERALENEKAVGGTRPRSMNSHPIVEPCDSTAPSKLCTFKEWLDTRPTERKVVQIASASSEKGQDQRDQVLNAYIQHFESLLSSAKQPTTEAGLKALLDELKV